MKATTVDGEIAGGAAEVIAHYRGWGKARWSAVIPGRDAELVPVPDGLPEPLLAALASMDRTRLYSHQRRTIELVRDGRDVLLVTSTASGKTLAFNAAILDRLLREPHSRALYLYPLNALANDQRQGLENLVSLLPAGTRPRVGLVTGQASAEEKRAARDAHLILTNPETVHFSILQRPEQWRAALGQLRFLVVDEAHMYRGAFGAHAAHVLRRLLRLARAAGADPQVIAASATIGNPVELGKLLTNREFAVVDRDGSAKPDRQLVVWEPPTFARGTRGSYEAEAVALLVAALRAGRSAILFARSRRGVESLTSDAREQIDDPELAAAIQPYRGGYTSGERRSIEDGLRSGRVRAVVTTNALEVGIDIGSLDVVIVAGYPGTMMAFWQQAGRAGRRGRSSQVFFVPSANPLDEYFAEQPARLLETPHELATFDLWNPRIAVDHVLWSAQEVPIRADGPFGPQAGAIINRLRDSGALQLDGSVLVPAGPHDYDVSMRSLEGRPFQIIDPRGNQVGEVDEQYLYRECHQGAIYPHLGRAYRVAELDEQGRRVLVTGPEQWTTETRVTVDSKLTETSELSARTIGHGTSAWGVRLVGLEVSEYYVEYQETPRRGSPLGAKSVAIDPPLHRLRPTVGLLIDLPPAVRPPAAHAIEHALLGMVPTEIMCDRRDFVGLTSGAERQVVALYDRNIHGLGFAERAFERLPEIIAAAAERVGTCRCEGGCPLCVQSATCERWNDALAKDEASLALDSVLGLERQRRVRRVVSDARQPQAMALLARQAADSLVSEYRAAAVEAMEARLTADLSSWTSDDGWSRTDYKPGLIVRHPAFGEGTILEVQAGKLGLAVIVDFRGGPKRRIMGGEGNLAISAGSPLRT